jgi:hypothetical protein
MPTPVTRAQYAASKGVSRAAVTLAAKGPLKPACLEGGRVDAGHPAAIAWHAKGRRNAVAARATTAPRKKARRAPAAPTARAATDSKPPPAPTTVRPPRLNAAGFSDELADFTLSQIVDRWGSVRAYADATEANGKRERAHALRLKNDALEGKSISRDLVRQHVFGSIDAANRRLLGDSAKTIARRVYALAKGGAAMEEAERTVTELISSQLKRVKETAVRVLRAQP